MVREPSLHITKSVLIEIYRDLGYGFYESVSMVEEIMMRAKAKSIHTRTVTISDDKLEKKLNKLLKSSRADADLFARIIYTTRKHKLKHKGISQIKPGGRDWETVKEITGQALEFCEEYDLNPRKGFILYAEIGISKMKKFILNKFLGMYEGICERYEAVTEIGGDEDSEMTEVMYKHYNSFIISNTGIFTDLKLIPEKYVYFVKARQQAKELNLSPKIYIDAQFEELDFTKNIPHPSQLVGVKAIERVMRYCYKNQIRVDGKH